MTSPVLSVSEILNFTFYTFIYFFLNILNITITFHWVIGSQRASRSSVEAPSLDFRLGETVVLESRFIILATAVELSTQEGTGVLK